jgi:RNA polymerase sigma factor (sigma-70 family)
LFLVDFQSKYYLYHGSKVLFIRTNNIQTVLKIRFISDVQIIKFICSGGKSENKAIQYILDKNRAKIMSYVLKNSGSQSDADSVLIEGVTHLIFNVRKKSFRGESALSTYLFSICRGVWLKTLKKEKRYVDFDDDKEISTETSSSPLDFFSEGELKKEMSSLLGQIGGTCKKVLKMWSEHYSMTEISEHLGYKNSQIAMNKKNKCLTKLKEIVKQNRGYREQLTSYLD